MNLTKGFWKENFKNSYGSQHDPETEEWQKTFNEELRDYIADPQT